MTLISGVETIILLALGFDDTASAFSRLFIRYFLELPNSRTQEYEGLSFYFTGHCTQS